MDERTLTALKGSIAKWEAIVAGTGEDLLADNCALCQTFDACCGCPVADEIEQDGCEGTPWIKWHRSFKIGDRRMADTPDRKRLAQAELDFLRSLLPDAQTPTSAQRPSDGAKND